MKIQEAIVQLLKADAGVSAITSAIYPQEAYADDVPPMIEFVCSDSTAWLNAAGYFGIFEIAFQFDCYGPPPAYGTATALAKAVEGCLFGFLKGVVAAPDQSSAVEIKGIFSTGTDDSLDPPLDGQEKGYDYVGVGVQVIYAPSK